MDQAIEELESVKCDIASFCRLHNMIGRIWKLKEELEDMEKNLSFNFQQPILDRLTGKEPSPERISGLLTVIRAEEGKHGFGPEDLEYLQWILEDYLPGDE